MFLPANITLKFGDSGDFVSELQRRLAAVNCFDAGAVNGFFDGVTVNGVSMFQSMNGLKADGIAGPETLRRLNGVISGDTSTTSDHNADQDRLRQEEAARQLLIQEAVAQEQRHEQERLQNEQLAAERATQAQQWQHTQAPQQPPVQYAQEAVYAQQQQHTIQQQTLAAEQQQAQAQYLQQQQQVLSHAMHQPAPQEQQFAAPAQGAHHPGQHPQPMAGLQAQQQPQAQTIPVQPQQQHAHAAHAPAQVHVIAAAPPVAAAAAPPVAAAAAAVAVQAQPAAAISPQVAPAQAPAAEPATGIKAMANRAVQYANDMVQKLSNYFESKLRPDVIDQVKEIGQVMARSGVREAAIPMGPEPQRAAETPTRAPQQQSQRG